MHGEEGEVEPDEDRPEAHLAPPLAHQLAGHLRQPVVEGPEEGEDHRPHHHVVEVGDDEVGVVDLGIEGDGSEHHPGQAAEHEDKDEADDEEQRRLQHRPAGDQRGDPGKDLYAARDGDHEAHEGDERQRHLGQPGHEHVVGPHPEPDERGCHLRHDDPRVADHPASDERRDDGRHDTEGGQHDDVDLGVPEDPEEVLPQQRVPAFGSVEEVEAEPPLQFEEGAGHRERGKGEHDGQGHRQLAPDEDRDPVDRHPGSAHLQDGDDEVDRAAGRRDGGEDQPEGVEVDVDAGSEPGVGQRRVGEPAGVGCPADEERRVEEDPRRQEDPVAEGVEAREGHVARPDHQRDEEVAEPRQHGHGEEEHHRHAVHREELVVGLRADQVQLRPAELGAQDQ